MTTPAQYEDFRAAAQRRLPRALFEFIDRGTEAETSLRYLRACFERTRIVPRTMLDVTTCDTSIQLWGERRPLPFVIAPTAFAGLVRHDGEVLLARAAAALGIPFCVATQSTVSIEHIKKHTPGAELWFQLYVWRDLSLTWQLLERVAGLGVEALLLTVDTPASPKRTYNVTNGFGIPLAPSWRLALDFAGHPAWAIGVMGRYLARGGIPSYGNYPEGARVPLGQAVSGHGLGLSMTLDRNFVLELRRRWPGKLIIKGVLSVQDTLLALETGADGIVVSSHGGRNFDSAPAPIEVLPAIADAARGRIAIFADSGVQRGSDAAKLIACGADAVLLGRLPLYGLAAGGERGARAALVTIADELRSFLTFAGRLDLTDLRNAVKH